MTFDIIGDVAVVNEINNKKELIKIIKERHKHIKTICQKIGKIEGEERIPKIRVIWGKETETIHKENGFKFKLDVKKVFYTPRMQNERAVIISKIKPNEKVLDMFAGVGPFAIPIAKKARVTAIDINKDAISYLRKNCIINKVLVKSFVGDCREIILQEKLKGFDRIIMNFPKGSVNFLKTAVSAGKKGTIIHLYIFEKDEKTKFPKELRIIEKRSCGDIAPGLMRVVYDLEIK